MFRIEDAQKRIIRRADGSEIITVINPTRRVKLIASGHVDSVTQGYAANAAEDAAGAAASAATATTKASEAAASAGQASTSASQSSASAAEAAASASASAEDAESAAVALVAAEVAQAAASSLNVAVIASVGDASAAANRASTSASNAASSASQAAASATTASNAEADARKLATNPQGATYTLSDSTTGYSAQHYAETAAQSAQTVTAAQATLAQTLEAAQNAAAIASQAQIDAQNTITAIAGSHTDFHQRYLGDYSADPTTGLNGAALAVGDLYYNTTNQVMRINTATSGWIDQVTPSAPTVKRNYIFEVGATPSHIFNGPDIQGNTLSFTENNVDVYLNGTKLREDEFVENAATNTITINTDVALAQDDNVGITAYEAFSLADIVTRSGGGTFAGAVTFSTETAFNNGIDVQNGAEINGQLDVTNAGAPLLLDTTHTSQLVNQSHGVIGFEENGQSRGDIGVRDGHLYIESRNAGITATGLEFRSGEILPRNTGNPTSDQVSLGSTTTRFDEVHTDNLFANGRNLKTQTLSPVTGDLTVETINGVAHYKMPGILAGSGIDVHKSASSVTITNEACRLLAVGFYRPDPTTSNQPHILPPNYWHGAPINDWVYRHPEYLSRAPNPASGGFTVPFNRKFLIEYGASMGWHYGPDDEDYEGSIGPVLRGGPLKLRLGCPTLLGSNGYLVDEANGWSTNGEHQQLYGSYLTPASLGYTEFRIEGRWPFNVTGSWSKENIAYTENLITYGPAVAWVRIWDTELPT